METFELSNMLLALLAYPDSETKRHLLESKLNRLTSASGEASEAVDPTSTSDSGDIQALELSVRAQVDGKRIWNRLDQRMRVALMFRPFVKKWLQGQLPDLPAGLRRYSINELSRYVTSDDQDVAHNFEKRWFRSTLPVLHLAIAFDLVSTVRFGPERQIRFNVHDQDFVADVLLWSVWFEGFVIDNELYSVNPLELIRLRPDE